MSDVIATQELKSFINRIERLEEDKKTVQEDIKEVYAEAKGFGFDVKIIRKIIAKRKIEPHILEEEEALLDIYLKALA